MPPTHDTNLEHLMQQLRAGRLPVEALRSAVTALLDAPDTPPKTLVRVGHDLLNLVQELELSRRGIERARREWTAAIDAVTEPVFLHDREFNIIRANKAYAEAAGLPLPELLGRPYYEVFPKSKGPTHLCQGALETKQLDPAREELHLVDGKVFVSRDYPLRDLRDQYLYSVHLLDDVTEARSAEQALRRSEAMLNRAERLAHLGSWAFDPRSGKMIWSAEVAHIFGLEEQTESGNLETLLRLVHPDDRERVAQTLKGHLTDAVDLDFRIAPFEDLELLIHEHAEPLEGDGAGVVGTFQDVTESRATEAALLQRSLDLGERVKELDTLFKLSRLIDEPGIDAPRLLQQTAALIPVGMQHPERVSVLVELSEHRFHAGCTPFLPGQAEELALPIKIEHRQVGTVAVAVQRGAGEKETIQPEERNMLAAIAERLGHVLGRWQLAQARREAEHKVRDSNALLEQVFENVHLLIAYLDADFNFLRVNSAYAAIEGQLPAYFVGKNHFALYPNAENEAIFRRVVRSGERFQVQAKPFSYPNHPEWGISYWDWTLTPVKNEQGVATGVVLALLDVTERTRAEGEVHRSETSLKQAQAIAHLGNWDWNIVSNELAWSDEIYRIFGLHPQQFGATYIAFLERVHPDDRQAVIDAVNHAVAQHTPYGIVHRLVRPNGDIRVVREQGQVTYGPEGQPLRMVGVIHDITQIVQAEAMSQRLGRILDHAPTLVLVLDAATLLIVQVNEGTAQRLGSPSQNLLGHSVAELLGEVDLARLRSEGACLRSGETTQAQFDIELHPHHGDPFPAEVRLSYAADEPTPLLLLIAQDITQRKQTEAELLATLRALKTISTCNKTLIHAVDETRLLGDICKLVVEVGGYPMAWVGLARQDERRTVDPVAWASNSGEDVTQEFIASLEPSWSVDTPKGYGPAGRAIRTGAPVVLDVTDPDFEPWRELATEHGFASALALPLTSEGIPLGALTIYADQPQLFTEAEIAILSELADDLAFGMTTLHTRAARHHAEHLAHQRMEQLGRAMEQTIRAIALTIEKRDPYTAGHQLRVADLAAHIAQEMGLLPEQIEAIHMGGQIHDIGKIYVPAEILGRPGTLTTNEMNLIRAHPEIGHEIVAGIEFPWPVADIIRYHHERLDGSGYPDGLKGEAIPLEARVLAVADVVEAMASHRPYRPGWGIEPALAEVEANAGTLYDRDAVAACLRLFRERGYVIPPPEERAIPNP